MYTPVSFNRVTQSTKEHCVCTTVSFNQVKKTYGAVEHNTNIVLLLTVQLESVCVIKTGVIVYFLFERNICKRNRGGGDVQRCSLCICPMYIICTLPEQPVPNFTWKNTFFADLV